MKLFRHYHAWGWPIRIRGWFYPSSYDSHQSCMKCGVKRYFSFEQMKPGPEFSK